MDTAAIHDNGPFRIGDWRVDPTAREATNGTRIRRFSPKAMAVLQEIVAAGGEVVRRAELLDRVWPDVHVGEESLTHAISELRRAFGDSRREPAVIETVQKAGYRLRASLIVHTPSSIAPAGPATEVFDLDAYLLCLEARRQSERGGLEGVLKADELGREAVARAPRFALAHAEFAVSASLRSLYRQGQGITLVEAAHLAETAVQLRPDLAYAHAAKGFALGALGRIEAARTAFGTALARDPNDFESHYLCARALHAAGEAKAATTIGERAAALKSDDYRALYLVSRSATVAGDLARACAARAACLRRVQRRLEIDPHEPRARNILGPLLAMLDRPEEAIAAVERDEQSGAPLEFYNVVAMARVGEIGGALDRFEAVVDGGWRHGDWLKVEPAIAALHHEPRFRRIATLLAAA
ncbi:MAG: winged helix-turn-helix domain-containing protein [Pseudomonadota bacterium]